MGLKLTEIRRLLAYGDYVDLLGDNIDIINKNTDILIDARKEVGASSSECRTTSEQKNSKHIV
jgi:hypothetical protein